MSRTYRHIFDLLWAVVFIACLIFGRSYISIIMVAVVGWVFGQVLVRAIEAVKALTTKQEE